MITIRQTLTSILALAITTAAAGQQTASEATRVAQAQALAAAE